MDDWDYIVIGAGSAGCAAAYQLALSGQNRVLLLESGGRNNSPYIRIYAFVAQAGKRFNWGYVSEPDPTRGGRTENWLRGKVLGGTSSINGTIFVRGAPADFDRWAGTGNAGLGIDGWSYDDVLPIYEEIETFDRALRTRGRSGSLFVRTVGRTHPLTDAFMRSAAAAGHAVNPDYNGPEQEGVSHIQLTQRRGLRFSAADAFIEPIRKLPNVSMVLHAHVEGLMFEGRRVAGVRYLREGTAHTARARHVVLSAGTINTPQLLMLSGIGDAACLRRVGIDVIADMPEVGRNLMEHPLVRLVYRSRISSNNVTRGLRQLLEIGLKFGLHRQGPISTLFEAIGFLRTSPDLERPDIQIHFAPLGYLDLANVSSPILKFPSFTVLVNKNYPASRGRISLASRNPLDAPLIEPNLLSDPSDLETLRRGLELVRRIVRTAPLSDQVDEEVVPGPDVFGQALRDYIPRNTELAYHPVGTCRMGADDRAVVAPNLLVNGFENLWIADASVMPSHISGNTNAACIMIGTKLGKQLVRSGL
jgi:choline dehydrogenase